MTTPYWQNKTFKFPEFLYIVRCYILKGVVNRHSEKHGVSKLTVQVEGKSYLIFDKCFKSTQAHDPEGPKYKETISSVLPQRLSKEMKNNSL